MEEQEKDTLFLLALAVFGAALMSSLATIIQSSVVLPLTIAVILVMVLTAALYNREKIAHLSENLENWAMIIVLILFVLSFIYLFRTA